MNHCQVNGRSLVGVTHHEAVDVLKEAGNDVTVVIARLTQKPKVRPVVQEQRTRTASTSSTGRIDQPTTDALPPQPVANVAASSRQGAPTSPTQPAVSLASQSLLPEPRSSARLSGTASPAYEVVCFHAINCHHHNGNSNRLLQRNIHLPSQHLAVAFECWSLSRV